jgi:hypothetical protein
VRDRGGVLLDEVRKIEQSPLALARRHLTPRSGFKYGASCRDRSVDILVRARRDARDRLPGPGREGVEAFACCRVDELPADERLRSHVCRDRHCSVSSLIAGYGFARRRARHGATRPRRRGVAGGAG